MENHSAISGHFLFAPITVETSGVFRIQKMEGDPPPLLSHQLPFFFIPIPSPCHPSPLAPYIKLRGPGKHHKLPLRGLGRSPTEIVFWHFCLKLGVRL